MTKAAGVLVSVAILAGLLFIFFIEPDPVRMMGVDTRPFRDVLWNDRALDLIGQMMIILAGTFGVLVLVKERVERR